MSTSKPFADEGKGWRILVKPYGWRQFDTRPGVYEEKWTDIVAANQQNLLVTTVPVKSTTTRVDALVGGDVQGGGQARGKAAAVGGRRRVGVHQGGRARERRLHQLLSSSASPSQLWQIDASCPESRLVQGGGSLHLSFMPKL